MIDSRAPLRTRLRAERDALDARTRMRAAQSVAAQLEHIPELLTDTNIAGYFAVRGELALNFFLPRLAQREQRFHLPVIQSDGSLRFAPWESNQALAPNRHGIPEPMADMSCVGAEDMDVILLPLLAFDRTGNRLGSGAGYYDRTLSFLHEAKRPAKPLLVGVAYAFQEVDRLAPHAWDVRLDFIATDQTLIQCFEETEN